MTRAEQLARMAKRSQAKLDLEKRRMAQVQAQQRAEARKALAHRQHQVGILAAQAGLLALDDATLAAVFALLAPFVQMPAPVVVLAARLGDPARPAVGPVDGRAQALPGVGPCRANAERALLGVWPTVQTQDRGI